MNSIKSLLKMVLCLAVLLWVPFVLVACGDDNSSKAIYGFVFENQSVMLTYNSHLDFPYQAFGVKVVYSDGTKTSIDVLLMIVRTTRFMLISVSQLIIQIIAQTQ